MLELVHASELQHGVMSGVNSQLDAVSAALQSTSQHAAAGGYQGGVRDLPADLQPFSASADIPSTSEVCFTLWWAIFDFE